MTLRDPLKNERPAVSATIYKGRRTMKLGRNTTASTCEDRRPGSEAFTLIEILVVTFIFAIVPAMLFGTWRMIAREH